jgi:hypothetical protein
MGPWTGGMIGSTVDQRQRGHESQQCFTGSKGGAREGVEGGGGECHGVSLST